MHTWFVVEANKRGLEHGSFNAAMLASAVDVCRQTNNEVVLFCERTHRDAILSLFPEAERTGWKQISVISGIRRRFLKKFWVEIVNVIKILLEARRQGAAVVFLSVFPNVLACMMICKALFRDVHVHIILHIELESLLIREKRPIHKEGFWAKLALMRLYDGEWPQFYVLGAGLKSRLLQYFPDQKQFNRLRVIEHPYLFNSQGFDRRPADDKIRIGFVGAGRIIKGIDRFFQLAASMADYVTASRLEFVLVGGLEAGAQEFQNGTVKVLADQAGAVPTNEFLRSIASLDCAVFLYRQNYSLTASGAVFDLINEGVEILALENHYLRDLSRWDQEQGIKFFENASALETELRERLNSRTPFKRFRYAQIKQRHSANLRNSVATMFGKE